MGATASVLAGAAIEPIKKAGAGVSSAVVAVKPSAETQKLVKMYAKEGYRQVAYYTKRGLRSAATGFTIARAIANKLDVAGSAKRKKEIDDREVARRKLLMAKKGIPDDDDGMVETVSSNLILVEGDEDELSGSGEDRNNEEQDMFHDIFSGGAAQGEGAETFYKESTADKLKKQMDRAKKHSQKLRLKLATKVCEPKWMPETKKQVQTTEVEDKKSAAVHHIGMDVMAAVKIKRMLKRRRKEKEKNQFQASMDALKTVNLDSVDGTDVQGWNRSPLHSVEWSELNVYIIRAYSDCQKEVNVIYDSVLPKIRQVMLGSAVNVHVRDLGCVTRPVPRDRPHNHIPPMGIALNAVRERNSIFLILVGYDYGQPWKDTSGTETLKDLGIDVPDEVDFPEEMSELHILAMRAASESEVKHTVYTSRKSVPRTFLYTCVDPDSPFRNKGGGYSPMRTGGASPGGSPSSPGKKEHTQDGGDGFKKAHGSRADNAAKDQGSQSPGGGGKSPLNRLKQGATEHGPESNVSAMSPLKLLKKKKKEEEKRKKMKLAGLVKTVLPALIRDPDTGQLRSPETTFQMIDADGSGRVDKSEFAVGLELCGLDVSEEDLDLMWNFLDDDGGGDLDVEEMCSKLQSLHKNIAEHEKKQASVMPRLIGNKIQPLLYGETFRMRTDVMKDFQDTAEKQEQRWLIKFGKDVLADLHGVCPIVVLAAQEFYDKQDKLMETSSKIPPVPLNFQPEVPEHYGHETIMLTAGKSEEEPMWKDADVIGTKNEILDYIKGLSNWPMCLIGDPGSGRTSLLAQASRDLRKEQPFDHILFHSVGGTPDSTDVSLFLFRLIEELKKRFDVRYELPDLNLETLMEAFPTVLLKAEIDSTLVLVIDNLDRLTKDGDPYTDLEWFPRSFPSRCRFIISCTEGKLLLNIRRNRLQFGGSVELHEVKMPRIQVRAKTPAAESRDPGRDASASSSRASSASHVSGSDAQIALDLAELGLVRALSRSFLFEGSGLAISLQTSLMDMVALLISRAEEIYGKALVRRFCVFVMISRQGLLEQDLYELLNAAMQQKIVMGDCRCSWQEFVCLKFHLAALFPSLAYGDVEILVPQGVAVLKCLSKHFANELMLSEAHELIAMHYRGQLNFVHGGTWNGECRRAVSEISHHMEHAGMWHELLELAGNLMYIEARSSLGLHQTLALCVDYHHIINKTDGPLHWIKTEVLRVRDCHTMVNRYAIQLFKHPRWVFGLGANLPDSTGVSQHAKEQWTHKKEVRPQLVWLNKPKVKDACAITLQEPKIVWHFGQKSCFSRDMRFLVTVGQDPRIFIWHPVNGHIMYTLEGHTDEVMSIQFSWDDEYLISASRDGSMILWKTPEEAPDRKAEEEEARERASQAGSRASGWSRARSAYSQMSATRPKTGISFKSQNLKGFPKQSDEISRASSSVSVAPKHGPTSALKVKSVDDIGKKKGDEDVNEEEEEADEASFSRALSAASSRSGRSSVKREVVGIQNWYPVKPIVATIPAHKSTLWSCAFSRKFKSIAELHVPITVDLGHNEFRIDHVVYDGYFLNLSLLESLTPDRFPVVKKGTLKVTRVLTENERNDQRVKRKEEMMHRVRSTDSGSGAAITRASSTGSASKNKDNIPVDDFLNQEDLAGKYVVITLPKEIDNAQVKRAASIMRASSLKRAPSLTRQPSSGGAFVRAPSFERASSSSGVSFSNVIDIIASLNGLGVEAIIIAMEQVERHTEIKGELPEVKCPVICVSHETVGALGDGQEMTVKRKLHRGNLVASASADHTIKIWDVEPAIDGRTQQLRRPVATLEKHKNYVSHVEFSHMGDMIVSSGGDFKVIIWNLKDFSIFGMYDEALAPVTCSVWSPDDSMILSTCHDGHFRLFSVEDQDTIKASTGPHLGHLWAAAWSATQDSFVTVGHEGKVVIWDFLQMIEHNKEKTVLEGHHGPILSCTFSPDTHNVVTVSADRSVRVWLCEIDLFEYSLTYAHGCMKDRQMEKKKKAELKDILERSSKGWANAGAAKVIFEKAAHPLGIHCVIFSPSGEHLVTGSEDCQIIFWSIKREQATRTLNGHEAPIAALKFTTNGEQLASGCQGGVIIIWDVATGRKVHTFTEHNDQIRSLDFNKQATRMISSSDDRSVKLWCLDDPYDGLERTPGLTIYSDSEDEQRAAPKKVSDGTTVDATQIGPHVDGSPQESKKSADGGEEEERKGGLTLEEQLSRARNQREGQTLFKAYDESQSLVMQSLRCDRVMYSVAFSPDGKSVVTGSADSLIRVYGYADKNENALVQRVLIPKEGQDSPEKHRSFVKSVQFDRDSRRILSAGVDGTMKLWSARNGLLLRTFVGHTQEVKQACISPDNKAVLSCSLDETCRMWNLDTGEELFQIKSKHCIFSISFSVNGKLIATGSHDGEIKLLEKDKVDFEKKPLRGWPRVRELIRRISRLRSSPIGLAQDGRRVCLIKKVEMLDGKPEAAGQVKDETQWITVENIVTGARDYTFALDEPAEYCTISDSGEMIIFARGTRLRVFLGGEQTYSTTKAHLASILDMRLSEDGVFLATGSEDSNCRIWRPTDEGVLVRVKTLKGHLSGVRCVCFSPDGRYLATGSSDLTVKLWVTATWKIAITFKAHTNYVTAVAFDAGGDKLCTGGEDYTIRVWSLAREVTTKTPPKECVRIRHIPSTVLTCDFTECGRRVVGVTQDRHVYVWHALQGTILCHWEFCPFDPDAYQNSVWRHALLSLNNTLNSVLVTDATGNTFKFVIMAISKPTDNSQALADAFKLLE